MDAASIAEITNLSADKVRSVMRQCNNDQGEIERAINTYLEGGGGPFKDNPEGAAWAESGKPRRAKKVRAGRVSSAPPMRQPTCASTADCHMLISVHRMDRISVLLFLLAGR